MEDTFIDPVKPGDPIHHVRSPLAPSRLPGQPPAERVPYVLPPAVHTSPGIAPSKSPGTPPAAPLAPPDPLNAQPGQTLNGQVLAPAAYPILDTKETSVGTTFDAWFRQNSVGCTGPDAYSLMTNSASRFRHSGWWAIRKRVWSSLIRTGQTASRVSAFCGCGAGSWIVQAKDDRNRYELRSNNCHDRLCTPCATARSFVLKTHLMRSIQGKQVKFITLTLCGKGEPLLSLVDRLYKSFRYLRDHPLWQDNVTGGAAFLEVKWSEKAKRWHPHLHIICEAKYIRNSELSEVWRGITKDSFIVDIRKVRDENETAIYVTKYASKPLNMSFALSPALLDEAVVALKGRRLDRKSVV